MRVPIDGSKPDLIPDTWGGMDMIEKIEFLNSCFKKLAQREVNGEVKRGEIDSLIEWIYNNSNINKRNLRRHYDFAMAEYKEDNNYYQNQLKSHNNIQLTKLLENYLVKVSEKNYSTGQKKGYNFKIKVEKDEIKTVYFPKKRVYDKGKVRRDIFSSVYGCPPITLPNDEKYYNDEWQNYIVQIIQNKM